MRRTRKKLWLGAAIWMAGLLALGALAWARGGDLTRPTNKVARWVFVPNERVEVELSGRLEVGDPVRDAERRYLGRVVALRGDASARQRAPFVAVLAIDPEVELPPGARFEAQAASGDWAWVLKTLLPPHKRELLTRELEAFVADHREPIAELLRPIAEDVLGRVAELLEANLADALRAREDQIQALLNEHRDAAKDELLPVLKAELGPSAKKKADPILREIGRELWDELPMWSLGWNAFVDTLPGTSRRRVDRWWSQFVEDKAIPILAAREDELLKALGDLIDEGSRSPQVRRALSNATRRMIQDPRFKALAREVLEDAVVKRFDARQVLTNLSRDPAHLARFERLIEQLEPAARRIGRSLTVDVSDPRRPRIDPDFARVLRRVILQKDTRWVELVASPDADGTRGP